MTSKAEKLFAKIIDLVPTSNKKEDNPLGLQLALPADDDTSKAKERIQKFLTTRQTCINNFDSSGIIEIGFHYTSRDRIQNIVNNGLMTPNELSEKGVTNAQRHGRLFGEGVYSGNNPFAFQIYGEVGVIVARFPAKGLTKLAKTRSQTQRVAVTLNSDGYSTKGNKFGRRDKELVFQEEVVTNGWQILPLLLYERASVAPVPRNEENINRLYNTRDELLDFLDKNILRQADRKGNAHHHERVSIDDYAKMVGALGNHSFARFYERQQTEEAVRQSLREQQRQGRAILSPSDPHPKPTSSVANSAKVKKIAKENVFSGIKAAVLCLALVVMFLALTVGVPAFVPI